MKQAIDARLGAGEAPQQGDRKAKARATPAADRSKRIVDLINGLTPRHRRWQVFQDMVTMQACAISNAVDRRNFAKREEMYMQSVKRYTREELQDFVEMLAQLTLLLEEGGPDDVLGNLYMKLDLGNEQRGQFFTPMHICDLMARLTHHDNLDEKIAARGFVTVNDPACGAGATLIAFAKDLQSRGFNHQKHMHVTATDVDFTAAMMCYIQLSLLHVPAEIVHGNTLTLEEFGVWVTPAHVLGGWEHKLRQTPAPEPEPPSTDDATEDEAPAPR